MDIQHLLSFESCRSSVVDDMAEVSLASSRKIKDKEETMLEASWAGVTGRKENGGWRLEPEGETETQEVMVFWKEAEGVPVHPRPPRAGTSKKEKRQMKRVRRCGIRRNAGLCERISGLSREEAEEISFAPSAVSVPPKPMFRCDNRRLKNPKFLAVRFGSDKGW